MTKTSLRWLGGIMLASSILLSVPGWAEQTPTSLDNTPDEPILLSDASTDTDALTPTTLESSTEAGAAASDDPWANAMITDTPYFSYRPYTVAPGTVQFETNFSYERSDDILGIDGFNIDRIGAPVMMGRFGVTDSTEVRLWGLNHQIRRIKLSGFEDLTDNNLGDGAFSVRQILGTWGGVRTAVEVGTTLPIGSKAFGGRDWWPTARLMAEKSWNNWTVNTNLYALWPSNGSGDYTTIFRPSTAVTYKVNRNFHLFTEYLAVMPATGSTASVLQHGFRLLPTPNQQVHLAMGYGLNDRAPSFVLSVGYSFRFNRLFQRWFGS